MMRRVFRAERMERSRWTGEEGVWSGDGNAREGD